LTSQPHLFDSNDDEPRAHARRGDPWTSHAAAASVTGIRKSQQSVLDVLKELGPLTDEEIRLNYKKLPRQSDSGLRTRRDELVALGKVRDSGRCRRLKSGRLAKVWEAL
jgi:hypothetical protein